MKFNQRLKWERREQAIVLTREEIFELIHPVFPNQKLEHYQILSTGLANINIYFKLKSYSQCFLLRLYMRDRSALKQEMALSTRFGQNIPMPEFLYYNDQTPTYSYAVQKWIAGKPLFAILDTLNNSELNSLGSELARILNTISSINFPMAGFFNENLEITPFEKSIYDHPFIDYIEQCLFQEHAGRWLGKNLTDSLWDFILKNQHYFPPLDSPCLVHGDFNQDNIIIDEKNLKVVILVDWEFAYSGSYLFDIGTLLRFNVPAAFETSLIENYQKNRGILLPSQWRKMIKIQDIANFVGLLNTESKRPNLNGDIKTLIEETLNQTQ